MSIQYEFNFNFNCEDEDFRNLLTSLPHFQKYDTKNHGYIYKISGRKNPDAVISISGLDYLKAIKEDRISPPPVANLVGYKISEVDSGYAVFELNPAEYHYNPFASVHGVESLFIIRYIPPKLPD